MFEFSLQKTKSIPVKLSEKVEGSVKLKQNVLRTCMLSKGRNSGITEGI